MDKEQFLSTYKLNDADLAKAGLPWTELLSIEQEYRAIEGDLRDIGKDFVDEYLYDIDKAGIHSYRYRTKAPDHLLEKIVRKCKEAPETFAGLDHTKPAPVTSTALCIMW